MKVDAACKDCWLRERCPMDECAYWRLEDDAYAILGRERPYVAAGVPIVMSV